MQKAFLLLVLCLVAFGSTTQAQTLDTLYFTASSDAGIKDTTFAQRKKIVIPNSVTISPSSPIPYSVKLRFLGEYDTLTVSYGVTGGVAMRTSSSPDTVIASHMDLQVSSEVAVQATATLLLETNAVANCSNNATCASYVCNPNFSDFASANICGTDITNLVERTAYWTSQGYAHYFSDNCTKAQPLSSNLFGSQADGGAYVGVSAYSADGSKANGYAIQSHTVSLIPNYRYVVSFKASLADNSKYAIGGLGIRLYNANDGFSTSYADAISNSAITQTNGWQKVSGSFWAENDEQTIAIGRFVNTANPPAGFSMVNTQGSYNGAYYFIDEVKVNLVPQDLTSTAAKCGPTLQLGSDDPNFNCWNPENTITWETSSDGTTWTPQPSITGLNPVVSPTATTTYRRTVTIDGIAFVSVCTVEVAPFPTVTFDIPRKVVCSGVPLSITAQPSVTGSYIYTWSATGLPTNTYTANYTSTASPVYTFSQGGSVVLSVTVSNGLCSNTFIADTIDIIKDCCVKAGFTPAGYPIQDVAISNPSTLIVLGSPRKTITYNALPTPIGNEVSTRYYVAGNIIFSGATITPATGSYFYVRGKATKSSNSRSVYGPYITVNTPLSGGSTTNYSLVLRNVTIRAACDTMWGGIDVRNLGFLDAFASPDAPNRIEGCYQGVRLFTPNISNNQTMRANFAYTFFMNNYKSIQFMKNTNLARSGTNINTGDRSIAKSVFSCKPSQILFPYDSVDAYDHYYSYAHLSNVSGVSVQQFTSQKDGSTMNYFGNALYGIKLNQHQTHFYVNWSYFNSCRIAAIWHTAGNITVQTDGVSDGIFRGQAEYYPFYLPYNHTKQGARRIIELPEIEESTSQIQQERALRGIADVRVNDVLELGRTFGVYADSSCSDNFTNQVAIKSLAPVLEYPFSDVARTMPVTDTTGTAAAAITTVRVNHIGYYGNNSTFNTAVTTPPASNQSGGDVFTNYNNGYSASFSNLRTGIYLEGQTGNYGFIGSRYQNNITGIRINRTTANNIKLSMTCNDFISTIDSTTMTYPVRTGIHLTGAAGTTINKSVGADVSRIGGCSASNPPVGNEVRNSGNVKIGNTGGTNIPTLPASNIFNFTYIRNQLITGFFSYYQYQDENVNSASVSNVGITTDFFQTCINENPALLLSTANTCFRTQVGVNERNAAPSVQANLWQNAPNPAAYETQISYTLPEEMVSKAQIVIYAPVSGKAVFTQTLQETEGNVMINLSRWATGIYPYVLLMDGKVIQKHKLAVIK